MLYVPTYVLTFCLENLVRDIKPPILFSPIFSPNFSQLEQLKKPFLLVQNRFFLSFGPIKSLIYFLSGGKNWGKQDSWFGGWMSRTKYIGMSSLDRSRQVLVMKINCV